MSSSEAFNFGRKIKELKKQHKKGYVDLTADLKISRDRIIQLEEGEREPTDVERQKFAAYYNLPLDEFTPQNPPQPAPSQAAPRLNNNPAPRPTQAAPGNFSPRPAISNPPASRPAPPAPRPTNKAEGKNSSDAKEGGEQSKPVMKYTAEQLGDIESAYLRKQRDLKVPLTFTFLNGKEFTGVVVDFTPFTVHIIDQETKQEIILRKLAMAFYRKADAFAEANEGKGGE
ncbi:MAG: hypothetical protein HXX08_02215 [Chloroflexi bacterium]|uniref:HTH cro/C1-type domain-containing protein n=1 Tax=Candidatus Chlorohelix allophototropha TaxID=3003348 RepID=A0A8T7M049_9CHLR|nr:hypothetical protein [Chloroflexota bacterium]WJW66560.1 hypothetical protein OZ401_002363 [Chloroflexota bacterium L227-S17]